MLARVTSAVVFLSNSFSASSIEPLGNSFVKRSTVTVSLPNI